MRKDVETFGRKAKVKFSPNLLEDSKRRDFTINSIYCDTKGNLKDPQNGMKDLKRASPIVKFIGDTEKKNSRRFFKNFEIYKIFNLLFKKILY